MDTHYYYLKSLLRWNTLVNLISAVTLLSTDTRIMVKTPVNPVSENGLLSVYCQVWNLEKNHQVTLLRQLGDNNVEMLSLDEDVLNSVPDTVFLAHRSLPDGSIVFFLSVTHVLRQDQGHYSCKVEKLASTVSEANEVLDVASMFIGVRYFPSMSPICTYTSSLHVESGDSVTLNCTAEISNPPVDIEWYHAGTDRVIPSNQIHSIDVTYASLQVTLSSRDANRVFLCKISSPVFPGRKESCHVGPFDVISNGEDDWDDTRIDNSQDILHPREPNGPIATVKPKGTRPKDRTISNINAEKCRESCPVGIKHQFPWIIAFVSAVVLTILFLVVGILLYVSYIREHKSRKMAAARVTMSARHRREQDIYSELDLKPGDTSKVYMPLELRDKLEHDKLSIHYSDIPKM